MRRISPCPLCLLLVLFGCDSAGRTGETRAPDALSASSGFPGGPKCYIVQVTPEFDTLPIGGQVALTATAVNKKRIAIPEPPIQWATRDVNVAAVSATGLVTGVGPGSAYVVGNCAGTEAGDSAFITVGP